MNNAKCVVIKMHYQFLLPRSVRRTVVIEADYGFERASETLDGMQSTVENLRPHSSSSEGSRQMQKCARSNSFVF